MSIIVKATSVARSAIVASKPVLETAFRYAKVELVPPKISDIPTIRSGIANIINGAKTGRYKELTMRELVLNTLVTAEVLGWFFIGECIGKRHLIGYDV